MVDIDTLVIPASTIGNHDWWRDCHAMIITSFQRKDIQAFPHSWLRLNEHAAMGAKGLADELGERGELIILFESGRPIASSGFLPSRGADWISTLNSTASDAELANGEITTRLAGLHPQAKVRDEGPILDWEVCCFNVSPEHRGKGLSRRLLKEVVNEVKGKGGRRLLANYSVEETGDFWPRMGFTEQIGKGSTLPKGFTHTPGMEGLREDLHFKMNAMVL